MTIPEGCREKHVNVFHVATVRAWDQILLYIESISPLEYACYLLKSNRNKCLFDI